MWSAHRHQHMQCMGHYTDGRRCQRTSDGFSYHPRAVHAAAYISAEAHRGSIARVGYCLTHLWQRDKKPIARSRKIVRANRIGDVTRVDGRNNGSTGEGVPEEETNDVAEEESDESDAGRWKKVRSEEKRARGSDGDQDGQKKETREQG